MTSLSMNASSLPSARTLTHASAQWRNRPADERFESLVELRDATRAYAQASRVVECGLGQLHATEHQGELVVVGPNGGGVRPTHFAFGQLCSRIGAPAGYLRELPAGLAAQAVSHGLATLGDEGKGGNLLLRRTRSGESELHAALSQDYARIWNAEIAERLVQLQDAQPWWTFPTAFKQAGGGAKAGAWGESKELPVAFASDRDMFVFLCDYDHGVEITQADGSKHTLARGFTISNSEVGAGKLEAKFFLFDFVCSNVLIWGARVLSEIDIRHVGKARSRFSSSFRSLVGDLSAAANASSRSDVEAVQRAQNLLIADTQDKVVSHLFAKYGKNGLGKGVIEAAYEVVESTPRYGDPRTVWGMVNGLTEVSQRASHADGRMKIDEIAGDLMSRAF